MVTWENWHNQPFAAVDAFGDPIEQRPRTRPYWAARWIQNAWRNAPWRNRPFETQYPSYQAMQSARRDGRRIRPVRARRNLGHFRTPQNLRRAQNAFQALLRNVNRPHERIFGATIRNLDRASYLM